MISSAVGGLWKFDREFAPLVPYLFAQARAGRVALGGLDDQLGSAGAFFANDAMLAELTDYLDQPRRGECREILRMRIYFQFPNYAAPEHGQVASCLAGIEAALSHADTTAKTQLHREMMLSMTRVISRELLAQDIYIQQRDRSMYLNFRWLAAHLPARSKIILWGATAHMTNDAGADRHYDGATNLGSLIRRDYKQQSFALGFSALSGSYRYSRSQPDRAVAIAPQDSIESRALAGARRDTVYLDLPHLKAIGTVPGRLLGDDFVTAAWQRALDGVVVFRQQRPPQRTDGP
jgi:erythromycin esterase-like protein